MHENRSFTHAGVPEAMMTRKTARIESDPIVLHNQTHAAIRRPHRHAHCARVRMPSDVAERLLGDAE